MVRVKLETDGRKKLLTTEARTITDFIKDVETRLGLRVAELRPGLRSPRLLEVSLKCWESFKI